MQPFGPQYCALCIVHLQASPSGKKAFHIRRSMSVPVLLTRIADRMERVRPPTDVELSPQVRGSSSIRVEELRCPSPRNCANFAEYSAWRDAMDDHGQPQYATATGNDYVGHERMYRSFVMLTRTAVAVIAGIVILMAIFLA
jgi:hypothetical protein